MRQVLTAEQDGALVGGAKTQDEARTVLQAGGIVAAGTKRVVVAYQGWRSVAWVPTR